MTVKLQDKTPLSFDSFFSFLSVIGRFEYTVMFLIIFLILKRKVLGIFAFGLFGLAHIIELVGKSALNQPGPPHMFLRSHFSDFPGLYVHTDASYPSGHSMRMIFLSILFTTAIFASKKIPSLIKIALLSVIFVLAFVVLYSRISLGEHWTTDVIGGSLLGISFAFFSLVFL